MKLEEIKALCDAATPGPWEQTFGHGDTGHNNNVLFGRAAPHQYVARFVSGRGGKGEPEAFANARFIAAARTLLPKLLAVAEAAANYRAGRGKRDGELYADVINRLQREMGDALDALAEA